MQINPLGAIQQNWKYDLANQLTYENRIYANPFSVTHTYDPAGNRTVKLDGGAATTYTYDVANQLIKSQDSTGLTTYTYDRAGNLQITQSPAGSLTTSTWNDENRQTLVQLPSGTVDTFVYNGDGLRYQKQDSAGTTRFIWDGQAYLAETDGTGATQVEYTHGPGVYGNLISQRRLTSGVWVPSYYTYDILGSVQQLMDHTATVTDTYVYKGFGEQFAVTGSTVNPFRWLGQVGYYYDVDTADLYVRARIYDPLRARWLSLDPIGFDAGDWNLYRYVWNRPTLLTDPSGLAPQPPSCCKKGMKCGPEVGAALELTLLNVRARLQDTSWYTKTIAKTKLQLWQSWGGWDMTGLVALENKGPCFTQRVGTVCETCVQVYGIKQDVWEVNYALWGMMLAAIGVALPAAVSSAAAWKIGKWAVQGEPNKCRPSFQFNSTIIEWIQAGYYTYDTWFWQTPSGNFSSSMPTANNPRFAKCDPCGQSSPGPFSYNLLPDLGGTNIPPRK
jgi:RHS repeat-associated protein